MVSLRILLSLISDTTEIELLDKHCRPFDGDCRPEILLNELSDKILDAKVIKIKPSVEFAELLEIILDVEEVDKNDVKYVDYKWGMKND